MGIRRRAARTFVKVALLGDIHGNAAALAAVLADARDAGAGFLCVTGDLVGYYYDPAGVIALLSAWPFACVRGNHEDLVLASACNPAEHDRVRAKYGSGIDHALALPVRDLAWLAALPVTASLMLGGRRILLCHGSPWDTDRYIYPDADLSTLTRLDEFGHEMIVLGHTHWRKTWQIGGTLVVNPGSTGQPRDRIPGAAWALLDTDTLAVEHRIARYDVAALVAEASARDPDLPYLSKVLVRE